MYNLHDTAVHKYETRISNHSYCKTAFKGNRIMVSAKIINTIKISIKDKVTNACTDINQPGNNHSRIT